MLSINYKLEPGFGEINSTLEIFGEKVKKKEVSYLLSFCKYLLCEILKYIYT